MKVIIATSTPDKVAPLLSGGAIPKEKFAEAAKPIAISDNPKLAIDIATRILEDGSIEIDETDYAVIAVEFDRARKGDEEDIFYDITQCMPVSVAKAQVAEMHRRDGFRGGPRGPMGRGHR